MIDLNYDSQTVEVTRHALELGFRNLGISQMRSAELAYVRKLIGAAEELLPEGEADGWKNMLNALLAAPSTSAHMEAVAQFEAPTLTGSLTGRLESDQGGTYAAQLRCYPTWWVLATHLPHGAAEPELLRSMVCAERATGVVYWPVSRAEGSDLRGTAIEITLRPAFTRAQILGLYDEAGSPLGMQLVVAASA